MLFLTRYLKPFKKELILGPAFKIIEAIFELIVPLVMARIIDVGIASRDAAYVWRMGGVLVLLGIVGLCSTLVCQFMAAKASQGVGTHLRNDLFRHINGLSHAQVDELGTATLINRMSDDVNQIQLGVAMLIRLAVRAPFLVIGSIIMAMRLDARLSLIFLAAGALAGLIFVLVMTRTVPLFRKIRQTLDVIARICRENLGGVRVIRAFSRQGEETRRFASASDDAAAQAVRAGNLSALLNPAVSVVLNMGILLILWLGAFRVDGGGLEQGEVVALVNYMSQILIALIVVANIVTIFARAATSATRLNEIFEKRASVRDRARENAAPREGSPRLAFEDVSFTFPGAGSPALSNISASVGVGQTFGIIGGTGSGKTALAGLIPRFYDATQGEVLVDGVRVSHYPLAQLRGMVGVVPQRAVLFAQTIRENMKWRLAEATDAQIWQALEVAQAADFVKSLPDGLDTQLLAGGKNLSGGQRQRLTIARALVGIPRILILDDSASALDYATDAALRSALRRHTQGLTVIMISQRVSSLRHADKILVLDDGHMAGLGTHDELLDTSPVYREICDSQLGSKEVSGT